MATRRTEREDVGLRYAASLALDSDPSPTLRQVDEAVDRQSLLRRIADVSIDNRTTLPVVARLTAAGFDLEAVPVDSDLIRNGPLPRVIPKLRDDPPPNIAMLATILAEHQKRLRKWVAAIGDAFPHRYMVGFGLGTSLRSGSGRESSDIDLFARSATSAHELAEWLIHIHGFQARPAAELRPGTDVLTGRKLWHDEDGHRVGVDLFGPGRPGGGHSWLPPYRDPGLLARARPLSPPGPAVLSAAPEDALTMLAEKTLRKGEFSHRRIYDTLTILTSADHIDPVQLAQIAQAQYVAAPLTWLLERAADRGVDTAALRAELVFPGWEGRMIDAMTTAAPRRATRYRAVHRRIWVYRYVRDAPDRSAALLEVLQGRFRKPRGERSR